LTTNCDEADEIPANRVNTTERLQVLRKVMENNQVDAYYVPLDDQGRRKWISGFSGSNGDAIVTKDRVRVLEF
jgi:Xaa-Pro aminopeptidase